MIMEEKPGRRGIVGDGNHRTAERKSQKSSQLGQEEGDQYQVCRGTGSSNLTGQCLLKIRVSKQSLW